MAALARHLAAVDSVLRELVRCLSHLPREDRSAAHDACEALSRARTALERGVAGQRPEFRAAPDAETLRAGVG